jgi:hypothetical protein
MLRALAGTDVTPALDYFKNCAEPRAVASLERLARDSAPGRSLGAVEALVAQGKGARASLLRLAQTDSDAASSVFSAASSLLSLRPALRALSIARLGTGVRVDREIFEFLAQDRAPDALSALTAAAREPALSNGAFDALRLRGDPDSNAALLQLQRSSDPELACEASHGLLEQPDSRSLATISRAMSSLPVRQTVRALLSIGAPEGSRLLRALGSSDKAEERAAATRLLVEFGPSDAETLLRDMLRDASVRVRFESQSALRRLGVEGP